MIIHNIINNRITKYNQNKINQMFMIKILDLKYNLTHKYNY